MSERTSGPVRDRRGLTLVEITIAITLLSAVFVVVGQFLSRWHAAQRSAADREFALLSLENALEHAAANPDTELQNVTIPDGVAVRLRSPQLKLSAGAVDDAGLVAVTGELSWQNAEGQRTSPVILTTWITGLKSSSRGGP